MRELTRSIRCISRLILAIQVITQILCFKQVLCLSLFRKAFPRRPVASVDAYTTSDCPAWGTTCGSCDRKNYSQRMCRSSGRRQIIRMVTLPKVATAIQQQVLPRKAREEEEEVQQATRRPLPRKVASHRNHTRLPP